MPRRSAVALAISPILDPVVLPPPPATLSPEEADRWRAIVVAQDRDWLTPVSLSLLAAMLRHQTAFERLCQEIARYDDDVGDSDRLEMLNKLLLMRDRESRAAASLSAKLRLAPSSRYDPQRAHTLALRASRYVSPPWEYPNPFKRNGRPTGRNGKRQ